MKVYVAGPITGDPAGYRAKFAAAAKMLRVVEGHTVVNPVELDDAEGIDLRWSDFMRRDLRALLECDAIFMLPGWSESRGARLENAVAKQLGMTVLI